MTMILLLTLSLGITIGFLLGAIATKAGEADAKAEEQRAWFTPTTANLANVEAILEAGSPISREDSLALCDALRLAWRANQEMSSLLIELEARLEATENRALSA